MISILALAPILVSHTFAVPQGASGLRFGQAVACADVNGDGFADVIVGEPFYSGTLSEQGRALLYLGSPQGPVSPPAWIHVGPQAGAHFGAALARAGDMNGDGYEEVVVGLPDFDGVRRRKVSGPGAAASILTRTDAGLVAFFLGTPAGLTNMPVGFHVGSEPGEHLGFSVASAGDVDGDGLADVVAGATGTRANRGAAFLFLGSTTHTAASPASIVIGPEANARFGHAVGGGGDLDADGYDDVLVGAPDGGAGRNGTAYFLRGSAGGLGAVPDASWTPAPNPSTWGEGDFGFALTIMDDMTGDGLDDAFIGDPRTVSGGGHVTTEDAGSVSLYSGSPSGPVPGGGWTVDNFNSYQYGSALTTGDVDGDGVPECLGGGPGSYGMVYVTFHSDLQFYYFFSDEVLRRNPPYNAGFGVAVVAGDVNGDGFDDMVVGEPYFDGATTNSGRVTVLAGSATFYDDPAPTSRALTPP